MSPDPARQVAIRGALIDALRADLIGPMALDEVIESRPSRWYLAGFLVPDATPLAERQDPELAEALSIDADQGDEPDDEVAAHTGFLPSSMGLSFLVGPGTRQLEVTAEWADYLRLSEAETLRYQQLERGRRRDRAAQRRGAPATPPEPALQAEPAIQAEGEAEAEATRYRYWKRSAAHQTTVPVKLGGAAGAQAGPEAVPPRVALTPDKGVYIAVSVRPAPAAEGPPGTRVVSLFLVNGREPQKHHADERFLFQARLRVATAEGFVARVQRDPSGHPDDRRNDLQYRDHPEWAVGHGVAAEAEAGPQGCFVLKTTAVPVAEVHRMKTVELAAVSADMRELGETTDADAIVAKLSPLLGAYAGWIAQQRALGAGLADPQHRETAAALMAEAEAAAARVQSGLQRLREDPRAFRAFQLANLAMAGAAERQRPGERPRWRLFQLAFVLLNIDGLSDPTHADRGSVELLFFPTGGGKTEAYLGLAAYTLFYRRLSGQGSPQGGLGVGVLLRYTLRLLTLDQLQRAAQLICAMELLRRAAPEALGAARFTVGVWVGRRATANRLEDVAPVLRKLREGLPLFGEPKPLPLEACPWCGAPFGRDPYALHPARAKQAHSLTVSCADEDCPFHAEQGPGLPPHRRGLPIVTVDEHVYHELPSILIGTVDKFAALPWRGASGNLFGRVRAVGRPGAPDEGVIYGNDEKAPTDAIPLPAGLLPPELIIQDELHLITGPLGTMVGLYETAIDALCRDKVPSGPKIVASTATARRASEQIRAVFGRDRVRLFPPQGVNDGDTFFAETDRRPEKTRLYVGLAAPGRAVKLLASRVYAGLLSASQRQWEAAGPPGIDNPADTYMSLVAYFNALRELGGAQRILQEEVNGRTRRLSERRPLEEEASRHFADRWVNNDLLELTSRQSTDQISAHAARMRGAYAAKGPQRTDVLLASSMISVGVDIPRLGLMVVNGQPRTVAEYIQATSRVGRETPGLVVTVFSPYKPRDRSHYERFVGFHESFYRHVEAASVTPFSARAIDRGLPGLVVALSRHLPPRMAPADRALKVREAGDLRGLIQGLLSARATAHSGAAQPKLNAKLAERVDFLIDQWQELVTEVNRAGGGLRYSPWEQQGGGARLLHTAVEDIAQGAYTSHQAHFRAPTSMRDVEPAVHIWVDKPRDQGAR